MTRRRLTSRSVVLTAAFLTLAAGGTAACDTAGPNDGVDGFVAGPDETVAPTTPAATRPTPTRRATSAGPIRPAAAPTTAPATVVEESAEDVAEDWDEEVFYCADPEGVVVEESSCDDDPDGDRYLLWHSSSYPIGLPVGSYLTGGDRFTSSDTRARRRFALPAAGPITNGTVKTNVVGRGSGTSPRGVSAGG